MSTEDTTTDVAIVDVLPRAHYVNYTGYRDSTTIVFEDLDISVQQIVAVRTELLAALGNYARHVGIVYSDKGFRLDVSYNDLSQKQFADIVNSVVRPRYNGSVHPVAEVVRQAGVHIGTIISFTLESGAICQDVSLEDIQEVDGVNRVNLSEGRVMVSFSLTEPTAENAQIVADKVADLLQVRLTEPVRVNDSLPNNCLLSTYDYRPENDVLLNGDH